MTGRRGARVVLLGLMSRMPVAGLAWATLQYVLGLIRLGCDVFYVEEHDSPTRMFSETGADPWERAAAYIEAIMRRHGQADRWACRVPHDGRCFGIDSVELDRVYASADVVVNLHGGTWPLPEASAGACRVYIDTDPVDLQVRLHAGRADARARGCAHDVLFTWALNYGRPDCRVPRTAFTFHPTPPPIVPDLWRGGGSRRTAGFTTVGNWRQNYRTVWVDGEPFYWSKDREFLKVIDLPRRVGARFELALSSYDDADRQRLQAHGWHVRDALAFSTDLDAYRAYIRRSAGEFTVAKDQNVRLRSGWFSERSASYLAAGRPVITQDTGFGSALPTGEGLLSFTTLDEAAAAVDAVRTAPRRHGRAAREIAREYLDYRVVLPALLARASSCTSAVPTNGWRARSSATGAAPQSQEK